MEPAMIGLGGLAMTSLITMGRMMYNYGRDRKELNGTVDRVKSIEHKLDQHISDEETDFKTIRRTLTQLETKVDLLVDHKIKE
jgi:formiminotetrahydrofolate cyclodeaminase